MADQVPVVTGDRVRVLYGWWRDRVGTVVGFHTNPGRPGGQQPQTYPVVQLDAVGTKAARRVRVLAVERVP